MVQAVEEADSEKNQRLLSLPLQKLLEYNIEENVWTSDTYQEDNSLHSTSPKTYCRYRQLTVSSTHPAASSP